MAITISTAVVSAYAGSSARSISLNVSNVGDLVVAVCVTNDEPVVMTINSSAPTTISTAANNAPVLANSAWLFPQATGAITVSATTVSGAVDRIILGGFVAVGVDSTTPIGSTASATGASTALQVIVPSSVGDIAVGAFGVANTTTSTAAFSTVSGETLIGSGGSSLLGMTMAYVAGEANSTVNMEIDVGWSGNAWIAHGFTLNAAGAAAVPATFASWWL